MSEIIRLENICFSYGEREVLRDFNLTLEKGTASLLSGPNGCGKTTLLKIINGLRIPQSGSYYFDGELIDERFLKDDVRKKSFHQKIGYSFQNPDVQLFCPNVYDEIAFGPRQMGLSDSEIEKRVNDCMNLLEIADLKNRAPYQLSGGEKRRVAIASVLSLNPDVLVMDEPTNDLDRESQKNFINMLRMLKSSGKTLIIVSHDLDISLVADNVVKM